jgi:hypothetical protein
MAKQRGFLKIEGTLGDVTFVKTQDGYLVKEKTDIGSRIASDKAFQRTRENNAEFGRAGKACKTLRAALKSLLLNAKDGRLTSRLTKEMMKVIKADATSDRGKRNVVDGEAEFLQGFDFNINAVLGTTISVACTPSINRVTGLLDVTVPPFVPANEIVAPDGATHYKLVSAGAEIDFESETFTQAVSETAILPWDNTATAATTLSNAVTANSTHPLFLVFGIQFFQEVNGKQYPLKNGAFNALNMVMVSGV